MNKEKEIDMLKEKLDYYTLVATDEEFDAEEVIKIVKKKLEVLSSFSIFVLLILLFYQEILQNLFDQQLNFYGHKMVLL